MRNYEEYNNNNPFKFQTPDAIPAQDIIDLFVPLFGEFNNIPNIGHTIINGSRGSGKSMMFRFMMPDCVALREGIAIKDMEYFSFFVPIKESQLSTTDFKFLEGNHGEMLLTEHIMVTHITLLIFKQLMNLNIENTKINIESLVVLYNEIVNELLVAFGGEEYCKELSENQTTHEILNQSHKIFKKIHLDFFYKFMHRIPFTGGVFHYDGPILLYTDFLFEFIKKLKQLPFMPNAPIYLLIDDADKLNLQQTKVLNSWISMRTTKDVSIKLSTQLLYKTFKTQNNSYINTPHDFNEINLYDKYTNKSSQYMRKMEEIVNKRLYKAGYIDCDARSFFPKDTKQENDINLIFGEFERIHGYDYAYRYSRPEYMKRLKGNLSTYSYAGFENIVNLSSGVVRHFIDISSRMYLSQVSYNNGETVRLIDPSVQDQVIKKYSMDMIETEFVKYTNDESSDEEEIDKFTQLRNLLEVLGQSFHTILFSDATEKRVFSVALYDNPSKRLDEILTLGVQLGYLHKSMIGNKNGTGRSRLYILNRMLAPYFKLDPSSFAGYKFIKASALEAALTNPNMTIGKIKRTGFENYFDSNQISFFENEVIESENS